MRVRVNGVEGRVLSPLRGQLLAPPIPLQYIGPPARQTAKANRVRMYVRVRVQERM